MAFTSDFLSLLNLGELAGDADLCLLDRLDFGEDDLTLAAVLSLLDLGEPAGDADLCLLD